MAAIELHGLTKRFGAVTAVDDLTLELGTGTVTGFLGPNGAGKTTTLRMLLGLVAPSAGTRHVRRAPLRRPRRARPPRRCRAGSLQLPPRPPGRRSPPHPRLGRRAARGTSRRSARARSAMTEHAHRRVGGFSLGMRQRLGLAAALLGEPVRARPRRTRQRPRPRRRPLAAHASCADQADAGRTVIVSSHLLAEVAQTVDHVVILDKGRLITSAPLAELTARSRSAVIVRTPDADRLRAELAHVASTPPSPDPTRSPPPAPPPKPSAE